MADPADNASAQQRWSALIPVGWCDATALRILDKMQAQAEHTRDKIAYRTLTGKDWNHGPR